MGNIGFSELLLVFFIVLLFFGAKRIPEVAKALGKGAHEFKKASSGLADELEKNAETADVFKDEAGKDKNA